MSTILQKKIEHKTKQIENLLILCPFFIFQHTFCPACANFLPFYIYMHINSGSKSFNNFAQKID